PQGYDRPFGAKLPLQGAKSSHIIDDRVEFILTADRLEGLRLRGIEGDAQLIKAARDQIAPTPLVQKRAIGIEQHVGPVILKIGNHPRKLWHHKRFTNPVQNDAADRRILVDDRSEDFEIHVGWWLKILKRSWTRRAG